MNEKTALGNYQKNKMLALLLDDCSDDIGYTSYGWLNIEIGFLYA